MKLPLGGGHRQRATNLCTHLQHSSNNSTDIFSKHLLPPLLSRNKQTCLPWPPESETQLPFSRHAGNSAAVISAPGSDCAQLISWSFKQCDCQRQALPSPSAKPGVRVANDPQQHSSLSSAVLQPSCREQKCA